MAVGPHAQQDEVEPRPLAPLQAERRLELARVLGRRQVRVDCLAAHPVHVLRAHRDPREE